VADRPGLRGLKTFFVPPPSQSVLPSSVAISIASVRVTFCVRRLWRTPRTRTRPAAASPLGPFLSSPARPSRLGNFVASRGSTPHPLPAEYQPQTTDLGVRGSTPLGRANSSTGWASQIRTVEPAGLIADPMRTRRVGTHSAFRERFATYDSLAMLNDLVPPTLTRSA
jgi:hypothetical protein